MSKSTEAAYRDSLKSSTQTETCRALINMRIDRFLRENSVRDIVRYLDRHIIGQQEAKEAAAMFFYEHLVRVRHPEARRRKKNLLLIGPSGCGKTEIFRRLRDISPVPFTFFDSAGLSQSGWAGDKKVQDIITQGLNDAADFCDECDTVDDIQDLFEMSIIFLDEIDKVLRPNHSSRGDNVSLSLQGELLKFMEDGDIKAVIESWDMTTKQTAVSMKNVMIVCAGAFSDMRYGAETARSVGFGTPDPSGKETRISIDRALMDYGVSPEIVGRIGGVAILNPLTEDDYVSILRDLPESPLTGFTRDMQDLYGISVRFGPQACRDIALSLTRETGARGIERCLTDLRRQIVFRAMPGQSLLITGHDSYEETRPKKQRRQPPARTSGRRSRKSGD